MGLAILVLGLVLFIGAHVFVTMRAQRKALIRKIGPGPYQGLFALIAIAGIVQKADIACGPRSATAQSRCAPTRCAGA